MMSLSKPQRFRKPRFKDWLIEILDKNLTEDAKWEDRSNGIAVIRWPHKSRGSWSLEKDARLFGMWAVISGKFRPEVDTPNPKSWKCNFRMNLNICKNIIEITQRRIAKGPKARRFFKFMERAEALTNSCMFQSNSCSVMEAGNGFNNNRQMNQVPANISNGYYHYGSDMNEIPPELVEELRQLSYNTVPTSNAPSLDNFDQSHGLDLPIDNFKPTELSRMADNFSETFDLTQCSDPYKDCIM